jgi:hypothetical protein
MDVTDVSAVGWFLSEPPPLPAIAYPATANATTVAPAMTLRLV